MRPTVRSAGRIVGSACISLAVAVGCTACGGDAPHAGTSAPAPSTQPVPRQTSAAQDQRYVTEVGEADPALATYEQRQGNVALEALLTDGSAFCAILRRGGGIDRALVSEAVGARSQEARTHLPLSVTTFNTIEAVALLTLCPSELTLLPAADRSRIRSLGESLAGRSG